MLALALVLVGCNTESDPPQPGEWVDHSAPVGVAVTGSIGSVPHAALVRSVNALGAAVATGPVEVTLDGIALSVNIDGTGYGELVVEVPGTFEVGGTEDSDEVHAVAVSWDGPGILPARIADLDVTLAAPATGGALLAETNRVWWVEAGSRHPVLALPADVEGLRTVHLDADGVLDALAWAGDTLVLLKGRVGGGMSWAATLQGDEGNLVGSASSGDMSSDGIADLVVAWEGAAADKLQILLGDGLWSFSPTEPLFLARPPHGLDVGDNTGDGRPQVTVVEEGGDWERFIGTDAGAFVGTGPNIAGLDFPEGSTVLSGFDLNGDGSDQLIIFGPWSAGSTREAWVYDLDGSNTHLPLDTPAARFSYADADSDGLVDLWMLYEDNELVLLKVDENGDYRQRRVATLSDHGLLAAADLLGDPTPDALVVGDAAWTFWQGLVQEGDDHPDWEVDEPWWGELSMALSGPLAMSGEDIVGLEGVSGSLELHAWSVQPGSPPTLGDVATVRLGAYPEDALDLAVCEGFAWVLTPTDLVRVDIAGEAVTGRLDTTATRVDCGPGPSGATAALLVGSDAVLLDDALGTVGTVGVGGAADIALVDLGGGPEVAACNLAPCRTERWIWGDAGEQALAVGTVDGITLRTAAGEGTLAGRGQVSVADVDGDGHLDLVALHEGLVTVHRSTGEGIGPAEAWHVTRDLEAPLVAADADGDGQPDLWASSEGYLAWSP